MNGNFPLIPTFLLATALNSIGIFMSSLCEGEGEGELETFNVISLLSSCRWTLNWAELSGRIKIWKSREANSTFLLIFKRGNWLKIGFVVFWDWRGRLSRFWIILNSKTRFFSRFRAYFISKECFYWYLKFKRAL